MPSREPIRQSDQTYFVTFQTAQRRQFFRKQRWAQLFLDTLQQYADRFDLHDFVVMPDHIHLLITPHCAVEKAIQLIKGGFSFRAKRTFEWPWDVWQPGFSDHRIRDAEDYRIHVAYIAKNVSSIPSGVFVCCGREGLLPVHSCPPRLKPFGKHSVHGGAEAPP